MPVSPTKDPSNFWINVQEKTFSKWLNSKIKVRNLFINDLVKDLSDGVRWTCGQHELDLKN